MIGVLGILLSLGLLMYLAYRGINVLVLAPLLSLLAVLMGSDTRLLATYTQIFMTSLGGFVAQYFPLFLLGAIFGRLMSDSGSAAKIARWIVSKLGPSHALMAIVLACGILTYGGVSVFVVVFATYPVAVALFRLRNSWDIPNYGSHRSGKCETARRAKNAGRAIIGNLPCAGRNAPGPRRNDLQSQRVLGQYYCPNWRTARNPACGVFRTALSCACIERRPT